jgi:hypothetical protein
VATRKSDGKTLAIEHTLVEPFEGDKEDFAAFKNVFLQIEQDTSLRVPGRCIQVFVPVGTLWRRKSATRDIIANAVHTWIRNNRLHLSEGRSIHICRVRSIPGSPDFEIKLNIRVTPLRGAGKLLVRRQQVEDSLDDVVERVLKRKTPKLSKTTADKRILLLEREHMNLYPQRILKELESQKSSFPEFSAIDETWVVETMGYESEDYLRFEHYQRGKCVRSFDLAPPARSLASGPRI